MSLAILFLFLCVQHASDINTSIIRNLRLFFWITILVVLFLIRCVLEFRCGWVGVVSVLQAYDLLKNKRPNLCHLLFYFTSYVFNMFRTLIYPSSGTCDYSVELPHWSYFSWFHMCWSFGVIGLEWYPCCRLKPATHRTKNNTTNVVIQQNSCKLLTMDILMSGTCCAHKKWNKIASDIKLVFYSSTINALCVHKSRVLPNNITLCST